MSTSYTHFIIEKSWDQLEARLKLYVFSFVLLISFHWNLYSDFTTLSMSLCSHVSEILLIVSKSSLNARETLTLYRLSNIDSLPLHIRFLVQVDWGFGWDNVTVNLPAQRYNYSLFYCVYLPCFSTSVLHFVTSSSFSDGQSSHFELAIGDSPPQC